MYDINKSSFIRKLCQEKIKKSIQDIFLTFLFMIYKMVDIMKSLNINIGTVMKNPECQYLFLIILKLTKCASMQLKNYLIY